MTSGGYDKLQAQLKHYINVERPSVIQAIAEARAHGDLSENAEYAAAKEKQSFIEGKIQEIQFKLAHAEVIEPSKLNSDKVIFGATVALHDLDTGEDFSYKIVGADEADIKERKISIQSPIARGLIGKRVGDYAQIKTPAGARELEVLDIKFE